MKDCPCCGFIIHLDECRSWDDRGFVIECPDCENIIDVQVRAVEYEYTLTLRK